MPHRLKRITGRGDLHFITFCCYQRRPLLGSARARNLAVKILQQVRARYGFALVGFVFMPEHVHLLVSESGSAPPARIMQVFKQRLSRRMRGKKGRGKSQLALRFPEEGPLRRFWQRRYYDFNVYSRAKVQQKLHYMHDNPVREKLVPHPGDWPWSSWCFYSWRGAAGNGSLALNTRRRQEQEKTCPPFAKTKTAKGRPPRKVLRIVFGVKGDPPAHPLLKPKPQRVGHPGGKELPPARTLKTDTFAMLSARGSGTPRVRGLDLWPTRPIYRQMG